MHSLRTHRVMRSISSWKMAPAFRSNNFLMDKNRFRYDKNLFSLWRWPLGTAPPLPVPCRSCMQGKRWHLFIPQKYAFLPKGQRANMEKMCFLRIPIREWADSTNTAPMRGFFTLWIRGVEMPDGLLDLLLVGVVNRNLWAAWHFLFSLYFVDN